MATQEVAEVHETLLRCAPETPCGNGRLTVVPERAPAMGVCM